MTSSILWLLDRLQGLFRMLGVDYAMMRNIVEVKFTMDNRRNHASLGKRYQEKESSQRLLMVYGINALLGGLIGSFLFIAPSLLLALTIVLGYVIAWVALTLITDYSELLLDTTDNLILLPRPVSDRTIWMARLVHLTGYITLLTLSIILLPTVFVGIKYGWGIVPVFVLLSLQAVLIAVFLTTLLYMLVVRFSSQERVKDIISYIQIAMSILFTAGYQIMPRMIRLGEVMEAENTIRTWYYAVPSAWLAGLVDMFYQQQYDTPHLILSALAILVPPALIYVNSKYLAPSFTKKLAGLASTGSEEDKVVVEKSRRGLLPWLAEAVTNSPAERATFEVSWKITGRDRRFKMRTYPAMGSIVPLLFVIIGPVLNGRQSLDQIREGALYLVGIYVLQVVAGTFYANTYQSDDYKASWVYDAAPVAEPSELILGNFKAAILKFYTPFYLVSSVLLLSIWGWHIIDDLLAGYLFALFITSLEAWTKNSNWKVPFSQEPKVKADAGRTTLMLIMIMLVLPVCGLIHWGATKVPGGGLFMVLLYGVLLWSTLKSYRRLRWSQFQ